MYISSVENASHRVHVYLDLFVCFLKSWFIFSPKIVEFYLRTNDTWKWKWSWSVVSDSLGPNCSPPAFSSVHGIFQARVLKWVAIFFFQGIFLPQDQTQVSHIAGRLFTLWATMESQEYWSR